MIKPLIDSDELESEILLRMYYGDRYESIKQYSIIEDKGTYVVDLNYNVSNLNLINSKIFIFENIGNFRYKVVLNKFIRTTDEYKYLSIYKISDVERLFVTSAILGNKFSCSVLPDKIRKKLSHKVKLDI